MPPVPNKFDSTPATIEDSSTDFIIKSPYPDVPARKNEEMHEVIFSEIITYGEAPALTCGMSGEVLTYKMLYDYARGLGATLIEDGWAKGTTAAIILPNCIEFPVCLLGCWSAGLTVALLNPRCTPSEIVHQLEQTDAKLVITTTDLLPVVLQVKSEIPRISSFILVGNNSSCSPNCRFFSDVIKTSTTGVVYSTGKDTNPLESIAWLPFSSGTTGPPKMVLASHAHIATYLMQFVQENDINPVRPFQQRGKQERLTAVVPFFHGYGFFYVLMVGLYQGAHIMCLPRFQPETFLKMFQEHKPTCLHLVTAIITHIVDSNDYTGRELEPVRVIIGSGCPIGNGLISKLMEKAGRNMFFMDIYGMSEMFVSHALGISSNNNKVGSCGRPVPSNRCKVVDIETGKSLGPNKRGELLVKGPLPAKGYLNNVKATQELIDAEGWLHTGDVGYYDGDGYFYLVDRIKEMIKVKGFQVAPSELEALLRDHPKVADCAVVGIPSPEHGQVPMAFVVLNTGTISKSELHDYVNSLVATYKQLKGGIHFVDEIPRSPSGKILRRVLANRLKEMSP